MVVVTLLVQQPCKIETLPSEVGLVLLPVKVLYIRKPLRRQELTDVMNEAAYDQPLPEARLRHVKLVTQDVLQVT